MSMAAFLPDDLLTEGVITRRIIAWVIDVVLISVIVSALWIALFLFGLLTLGLGLD